MPVLVEALSVVVRRDAIGARFSGGWDAFVASVPNRTLCYDDDLAPVGFMTPSDVGSFVSMLTANGLVFVRDGKAVDLAVVDQREGSTGPCDWLQFNFMHHLASNIKIAACRLLGCESNKVFLPEGWEYERSLSRKHVFLSNEEASQRMEFVRREGEMDVYRDRSTGKEVYMGRTGTTDV